MRGLISLLYPAHRRDYSRLCQSAPRKTSMTRSLSPGLQTLSGTRDPLLVSIADARTISGLSRSELYRRMSAGDIRAVKSGTRTLIVLQSLIDHLKALPVAKFHASS